MAKIKNILFILLGSSMLLTFSFSTWAGGCCSKGSHEEETPITIATKPLSVAERRVPRNAFENEEFYSFKTRSFNKDKKYRRIIFVPTDLTSTQEAPSGTIHEIMEHADLMQLIFSFSEIKDIKALIFVSKDFNKILLGDGEENSLPWKIWIEKYNISVPQGRSYRDALKGHLYLVNSIADAFRLEFESAITLCDKACDYGVQEAIERRLRGYSEGKYDYPQNLDKAFELNEKLIETGNSKAIFRRIIGYAEGKYGYPKDPQKAFESNEKLAESGNQDALEVRNAGYRNGECGYPKDPQKAFELNEELANAGNRDALFIRSLGYAEGEYGYPKDPEKAFELNEELANAGNRDALFIRSLGYAEGKYGYPKDKKKASKILKTLAKEGYEGAIQKKVEDYSERKYISRIQYKSKALIKQLAERGNLRGIKLLIEGYINGLYGFPKKPQEAFDFNERLVVTGDKEAIKRAIEGYARGKHYGYPEDIPIAVSRLKASLIIPTEV
jgi:hypothetical protein